MAAVDSRHFSASLRHQLLQTWIDRLIVGAKDVVGGDVHVKGTSRTAKTGNGLGRELRDRPSRNLVSAVLIQRCRRTLGMEAQKLSVDFDRFIEKRPVGDFLIGFADTLSKTRTERGDVNQAFEIRNLISGFGDHRPAVTVTDEYDRSIEFGDLDHFARVVREEGVGMRAV